MLIPCIDLMGGRVVQLIGGEKKALEFDDPEPWVRRFAPYPLVHIVDLDAAMGRGSNRDIIARLAPRLACQVGGGVRQADDARQLLDLGARRVVVGSALVADAPEDAEKKLNTVFARTLTEEVGMAQLVFSVDARHGRLVIRGWRDTVNITVLDAIRELDPFCTAFLYTNVEKEGSLAGFPIEEARVLRAATEKQLMVGGGINSVAQVNQLDSLRVDAIVGMAVYSGLIPS